MKRVIALTVALFAVVSGTKFLEIPSKLDSSSAKVFMVETISKAFVNGLISEARDANPTETRATLLPPLNETYIIEPGTLPLNLTIDFDGEPVTLQGEIELVSEGQILGLNALTNNFTLQVPPFRPAELYFELTIPSVVFSAADHRMDMLLDLGTEHKLHANGMLGASVTDVFFDMHATLKAAGNLAINALELDLGFKNLKLIVEESTFDGVDIGIDWEQQAENIQTLFDTLWTNNPEVRGLITEAIKCSVDHIIKDCTLLGLIGGGENSTACLNLEIEIACLIPLLPVTDEPSVTTDPSTDLTSPTTEANTDASTTTTASTTTDPTSQTTEANTDPVTFPETSSTSKDDPSSEDPITSETSVSTSTQDPVTFPEMSSTTESGSGIISLPNFTTVFLLSVTFLFFQ